MGGKWRTTQMITFENCGPMMNPRRH